MGEIVEVADGVKALRVESSAGLPGALDQLINEVRGYRENRAFRFGDWRADCGDGEHQRRPWITGVWRGLELRLDACIWCRGVEVRDVSLDFVPGLSSGRRQPQRRDKLLGWYAGRRASGRQYI